VAEVVLFHHVLGLTDGVRRFGEKLSSGGHKVHTPDLYEGELAANIDEGVALMKRIGDDAINERADRSLVGLEDDLFYAGFSAGAATAQRLAQTRPGARGALLYEACMPITGEGSFGPWPEGVSVQIHGMDNDPYFALEGDIDSAREIVDTLGPDLAELFVYSGDQHLFTDDSLPSYDPKATELVLQRSHQFLERLG
jgi:dienelactone hydrolase